MAIQATKRQATMKTKPTRAIQRIVKLRDPYADIARGIDLRRLVEWALVNAPLSRFERRRTK